MPKELRQELARYKFYTPHRFRDPPLHTKIWTAQPETLWILCFGWVNMNSQTRRMRVRDHTCILCDLRLFDLMSTV